MPSRRSSIRWIATAVAFVLVVPWDCLDDTPAPASARPTATKLGTWQRSKTARPDTSVPRATVGTDMDDTDESGEHTTRPSFFIDPPRGLLRAVAFHLRLEISSRSYLRLPIIRPTPLRC